MEAEIHQTLLPENQREALKNCLVQIRKIQRELAGGTSRRLPCGKKEECSAQILLQRMNCQSGYRGLICKN